MSSLERTSFHEATVISFCKYDADLKLELEDVLIDKDKSHVVLAVSPVTDVFVDGELSDGSLMETSDGEVLSLDLSNDGFSVIVEWHDFTQGEMFTKSYRILGGNVSLSVI